MIYKNSTIDNLHAINKGTMMETLGIEYLELRDGYVYARMLVKKELSQPFGFMHGGAGVAMAESVGGVGSAFIVGLDHNEIRGQQMSVNYLKVAKVDTYVYAKAEIIHRGGRTHVWNIDLRNEDDQLVLTCRLTNFIISRP
ncbi:MAG TPA: PaaI family thioesterase [Bacteroidetes bacterium]|jgi:uncharacterized protein (TIGR00369 family)|nr:PaaI family thioesterase [Candidatus Limimorpha avicola]